MRSREEGLIGEGGGWGSEGGYRGYRGYIGGIGDEIRMCGGVINQFECIKCIVVRLYGWCALCSCCIPVGTHT